MRNAALRGGDTARKEGVMGGNAARESERRGELRGRQYRLGRWSLEAATPPGRWSLGAAIPPGRLKEGRPDRQRPR